MSIVIGLGSGRCGTSSLAKLINEQPAAACFHELNPSCMSYKGSDDTVISQLENFANALRDAERIAVVDRTSPRPPKQESLDKYKNTAQLDVVGDVASYYLNYIELIVERCPIAVFPCFKRDRSETIQSFIRKLYIGQGGRMNKIKMWLKSPESRYRNHWCVGTQGKYVVDRKWDDLFPTYSENLSLEEAVARYVDEYYTEIDRLAEKYPNVVRVFSVDEMNSREGQERILRFVGVKGEICYSEIYENVSRSVH